MLRLLHEHSVDWVLSGSAVLTLYGADLTPNDLDVVPSLDPVNLRRLGDVLIEIEAVPAYHPSWSKGLSLQQCQAWAPEPPTTEQLDHLFVTRLGMLDIPPALTGTYAELEPNADSIQLAGVPVRVCAPEDVLSRLPARPRAKDIERATQYAAVREALRHDRTPRAVPWFGTDSSDQPRRIRLPRRSRKPDHWLE